jgi:hypothetical protein
VKIAGQYVGLGLGDVSEEIRLIKAFMRKRFSYARDLEDTQTFDPQMLLAVTEMQSRYNRDGKLPTGKYTSGIINAETKYVMGYLRRPPPPDLRPVLLTACGTGVPWWVGPDADTARAVEWKYLWRPIGYPAAPFPMGKSIDAGIAEGINILNEERPRIEKFGLSMAGYSQGAIITSSLWQYHISAGDLAWAKPHMIKAVAWGNPKRQVGKAWPDPGAPLADPDTGGVDEDLMADTPDWWRNYAHRGDLYTSAKDDESRENKTAIWKIIRGTKVFKGPDSLLRQIFELLGIVHDGGAVHEIMGVYHAILDAGMFVGQQTGPHLNYNVGPAIDFLNA